MYPDFTNRPDQKFKGLNPGDSANPDTAIKFLLFLHRFNFKVTKVPNPCRTYDRHEYIKTVSGCDIFLTLGYYEPFGLMYVESAMLGVLPISTNVGITKLLWPRKTLGSYIDNDSNHEITLNRTADILRLVLKDINIRHRALSETNRNLHEMYSKSFNIVEALKVTLNDWLCIIK